METVRLQPKSIVSLENLALNRKLGRLLLRECRKTMGETLRFLLRQDSDRIARPLYAPRSHSGKR